MRRVVPVLLLLLGVSPQTPAAQPTGERATDRPSRGASGETSASTRDGRLRGDAALVAFADSLLGAPALESAFWGVLVVDPAAGDTLLALNARRLFMPASTMKVITAAVARATLGPDYRWRTPVLLQPADGASRPVGAVSGASAAVAHDGGEDRAPTLRLVGRLDPTWSLAARGDSLARVRGETDRALDALRPIAAALRTRGVTSVARVVVDTSAVPEPALGFGWAWDDLDYAYAAGVGAVLLDENAVTLTIEGAPTSGAAALVRTAPVVAHPAVTNASRTVRADAIDDEPIDARWSGDALRVTGRIAPGAQRTLVRAERHPTRAVHAAVVQVLRETGIAVRDDTPSDAGAATDAASSASETMSSARPSPGDTLVVLVSPPLDSVLPLMLKPSQNQIAEAVYRTLALETVGVGLADSARAIVSRRLQSWGIDSTQFAVRDGSGLSRHDYLTPSTLVRVLTTVAADGDTAFAAALPIAGVDGTLERRLRGTAAMGNARAKTGTVDKARNLAGYVTTADGRRLVFAVLANNYTVPTRDVDRVTDAIVAALAARRTAGVPNTSAR